jgi:hypothetical protein
MSNVVLGTIATTVVVDKIILKKLFPNFRINFFRSGVFAFKWFALPFMAYGATKLFFVDDI